MPAETPSTTRTTMVSASGRGTRFDSATTTGWKSPASAAAARTQPMTRSDAAITPMSVSVNPSITTARITDDGVRRSTAVRSGCAIATYGTGVPDDDRVIRADLDWRSVAAFLGAFVALVGLTALVRSAGRPLTWIGVGT